MKKQLSILFIIFCLPLLTSAQLKSQADGLDMKKILRYGMNPIGIFSKSLLDPDKFQMTQSYTMSMGSFGGQSIGQAMYLNTMSYQISNPLSISLQWGYLMNQPLGGDKKTVGFQPYLPSNGGFFISGAQLKYTPMEK